MVAPKHAYTIEGGCSCRAIRYRVSVPDFNKRSKNPYRTPGADIGDLRIPMTAIDHCNDCRRATAAVPPIALVTDTSTVQVRLALRSSVPNNNVDGALPDNEDGRFVPAEAIFDFNNPKLKETFLAFYKSTPKRTRWFCARCGTPLAYTVDPGVIPEDWGWPKMLDFWLGTVDRSVLQEEWMAPERMLWCEKGIDWVKAYTQGSLSGIPQHPLTKIDKLAGENVDEDLAELAELDK